MAKGYPDFFGQSIFPIYGSLNVDEDVSDLTGTESAILHQITGKGSIVGGSVTITAVDKGFAPNASINLSVTGAGYFIIYCSSLLRPEFLHGYSTIFKTLSYDIVTGIFSFEVTKEINFVDGFSLQGNMWSPGRDAEFRSTIEYYTLL